MGMRVGSWMRRSVKVFLRTCFSTDQQIATLQAACLSLFLPLLLQLLREAPDQDVE